jgi:CRP-like cAMP-binding protein
MQEKLTVSPGERESLIHLLGSISLFQLLPKEYIGSMLDQCSRVTLDDGDILCRQGEISDSLYILVFGKLCVKMEDSTPVAFIDPVSTIGEMGVFTGMPRSATVQAFTRSGLLKLKSEDIHALIDRDHELGITILQRVILILSERLSSGNIRISEIQNYLVELNREDDRLPDGWT